MQSNSLFSAGCVSREEFETFKYDLRHWQNMTLSIIEKGIAKPMAICIIVSMFTLLHAENDIGESSLLQDMVDLQQYFNSFYESATAKIHQLIKTNSQCKI